MNSKANLHRLILAGVLGAVFSVAVAQQDTTQRSSTIRAADGSSVTLNSGQPVDKSYGPAPAFAQLDSNSDGSISRDEAAAYPPLLNDFDFIAHHANKISKRQYERWNQTQNR